MDLVCGEVAEGKGRGLSGGVDPMQCFFLRIAAFPSFRPSGSDRAGVWGFEELSGARICSLSIFTGPG